MNYEIIYSNLITSRLNRKLNPNEYYEKHHIWPKSLGGSNDNWNIIHLTAREHFIAHWLLVKITEKEDKNKMSYALWLMNSYSQYKNFRLSSNQYEYIRNIVIEKLKNKEFSKETREKMSKAKKGKLLSLDHKRKIGLSSSKSLIGHKVSEETRRKLSKARSGNPVWSKTYRILFPDGTIQIIKNLSKFCRNNNLNVTHMSSCANKKLKLHKGFKCEYYEK